ncbi:MAG: hypothetical protein U1F11_10945 [Steroidobacteraceae bacterium]
MLAAVRRGAADPSAGFSARLEALGRQLPQGLWLQRIVLSSGDRPLALAGATNDARLVPRYLGALAGERSLSAARFDRFELRRPKAGDVAAAALFQVGDTPAVPTGDEP